MATCYSDKCMCENIDLIMPKRITMKLQRDVHSQDACS